MEWASKASVAKRSGALRSEWAEWAVRANERSERQSGPFKTRLSRVETGPKGNTRCLQGTMLYMADGKYNARLRNISCMIKLLLNDQRQWNIFSRAIFLSVWLRYCMFSFYSCNIAFLCWFCTTISSIHFSHPNSRPVYLFSTTYLEKRQGLRYRFTEN